jgi:hypothetical protein
MNAMGSTAPEVSLYARAISHSGVLRARRGMKHIPRCGSLDLLLVERVQIIVLVLKVPDIAVSLPSYESKNNVSRTGDTVLIIEKHRPRKRMLLSLQKGITTPADWSSESVLTFLSAPVSHTQTWRSLMRLNPVVAMRSCSPIHTTTGALDTAVTLTNTHGVSSSARVEQSDLAIARRGGEELAGRVET